MKKPIIIFLIFLFHHYSFTGVFNMNSKKYALRGTLFYREGFGKDFFKKIDLKSKKIETIDSNGKSIWITKRGEVVRIDDIINFVKELNKKGKKIKFVTNVSSKLNYVGLWNTEENLKFFIEIYDLKSKRMLFRYNTPKWFSLPLVSFSSDENFCVYASNRGVFLYDFASRETKKIVEDGKTVVLSPDNSKIAVINIVKEAFEEMVRIIDINSGREERRFLVKRQIFQIFWPEQNENIIFFTTKYDPKGAGMDIWVYYYNLNKARKIIKGVIRGEILGYSEE